MGLNATAQALCVGELNGAIAGDCYKILTSLNFSLNMAPQCGVGLMIGRFLIVPIKVYQMCLAPWLGPRCRFYPSCSRYAVACLEKDPFSIALKKISCRILRCHPWHPGGVDLP